MKIKKWTPEIIEWVKARCPLREHGYGSRKEFLAELNETFGTDFAVTAFANHVSACGIQTGLLTTQKKDADRTKRGWRHRNVGEFMEKKGYILIKVAEPNKWISYAKYVWEQNHPDETCEGMYVIFLDGNTRNFEPSNLERVSRNELSTMNRWGNNCMSAEERKFLLMRVRISMAEAKLLGGSQKLQKFRNRLDYHERKKNDPEFLEKRREISRRWAAAHREKARESTRRYRENHREKVARYAREYRRRKQNEYRKNY